jgi:1-acyl-sn-glycerol-3-phosphate acyltransferase
MAQAGAQVANHGSWLDVLVLNAGDRVYFVSKSEVSDWPGIGWLARATGTLFISRRAQEAGSQKTAFEDRLQAGHRLLFFPEGTSTDAQRILPFKSSLFAAFFAEGLEDDMHIQPVTVSYKAPDGVDPRFYGWWGDMGFGDHALRLLAARRQGSVEVTYHAPLAVADATDRKALAKSAEEAVKSVFPKLPSVS